MDCFGQIVSSRNFPNQISLQKDLLGDLHYANFPPEFGECLLSRWRAFFCPDLFYHVIKQESETGKCNMRKNDHLKIAWVNVFTESPQQLFLNSCELCKFVNEASLTLVFVSACIDCPDFLFHVIKDEDLNFITMFLSSRYLTYQGAF